jgi:outer membrane lipoprotein-sorting protein
VLITLIESRLDIRKMKKIIILTSLLFFANPIKGAFSITPEEIVKKVDDLLRGKSNVMTMQMIVTTPDWTRENTMKSWSLGTDKAFVKILSPAKDKDTRFLKLEYNLWMYIPKVEKVIKIPPVMMMESFMGSDFSYDDLVKESSMVKDYVPHLVGRDTIEQEENYVLELIPKPDAPVVYGKLKLWVRAKDLIPVREEFYSEKKEVIKVMIFKDIKKMGDRLIPTFWEMTNLKKKDHKTIIKIKEAQFDLKMDPSIFTKRNLSRIG